MSLRSDVADLASHLGLVVKGLVSTSDPRLADQRTPLDDSVTSAKIANGTIVDADINASAAIALTKLATGRTSASKNGTPTTVKWEFVTEAQYNTMTSNGTAEASDTIYVRSA